MDDVWIYFHNVFVALVDKYAPTSSTSTRKHSGTKRILQNKSKRKAWIKYKITQTDSDYLAYM